MTREEDDPLPALSTGRLAARCGPELQGGILAPVMHWAGVPAGHSHFCSLCITSWPVSPWSILAVLHRSCGLQISSLAGSALFGWNYQRPLFLTLACTIHLAVRWLCQLLTAPIALCRLFARAA